MVRDTGFEVIVFLSEMITSLKLRVILFLSVMLFWGLDKFFGHHLFGNNQTTVEILFVAFAGFSIFYLLIRDERTSRKQDIEIKKQKADLLVVLQAKNRNHKFKIL